MGKKNVSNKEVSSSEERHTLAPKEHSHPKIKQKNPNPKSRGV